MGLAATAPGLYWKARIDEMERPMVKVEGAPDPSPPVPEPPSEEPVKGPDITPKAEAPVDWWKKPRPEQNVEPVSSADKETQEGAVDILVGSIDLLHDRAADSTHYEGWRLSPKEIELWRKVLRFMLRRLKMKDWDLVVAIVGLVIAESSKVMGYMQFRKSGGIGGATDKRQDVAASKVPAGVFGGDLAGEVFTNMPGGDLARA